MQFEEFAAARLPAVLRFAGVLTGDRALAEDVVQEVLLRASQRWDHLQTLDRPEAYVRKMVVNEYLSWRRRNWRLLPAGSAHEVDDRIAPDYAGQHAERDALLAEIDKLPRRQRAVFVLRSGSPRRSRASASRCTAAKCDPGQPGEAHPADPGRLPQGRRRPVTPLAAVPPGNPNDGG